MPLKLLKREAYVLQQLFYDLYFGYYFICLNKMNSWEQDRLMRVELQKKHQLYKQMLDQQMLYKQNSRNNSLTQPVKVAETDRGYSIEDRQRVGHNQNANYLPYLQKKNSLQPNYGPNRYKTLNEDDRTDAYLNSCEEIISNLRQMKNRKKQIREQQAYFTPTQKHNEGNQKSGAKYYPRPTYFSSATPYRMETMPSNSKQMTSKNKYSQKNKKIDKGNPQNDGPKNIRVTFNKKKAKRNRRQAIQYEDQLFQTQPDDAKSKQRSKSPKSKAKRSPFNSESKSKSKSKPKRRSMSDDELPSPSFNSKQQEERQRQQQSLAECLLQLSRYLKNQRQEKQRKNNLINQQVQVGLSGKESNKEERKHQIKLNTLLALRRLNDRSHQFVTKMETERQSKTKAKARSRAEPRSRISQDFQRQLSAQSKRDKARLQSPIRLVSSRNSQLSLKKQNEQLVNLMLSHLQKQDNKNQEMVSCMKQLTDYLKIQNQQIQLLKESRGILSKSMGKKPTQGKIVANNKNSNKNSKNNNRPLESVEQKPKKVRLQQYPKPAQKQQKKPQREITKEEQKVLRDAFLKRLKKARLRGSLFSQKIQTYKKQQEPTKPEVGQNQPNNQNNPPSAVQKNGSDPNPNNPVLANSN